MCFECLEIWFLIVYVVLDYALLLVRWFYCFVVLGFTGGLLYLLYLYGCRLGLSEDVDLLVLG